MSTIKPCLKCKAPLHKHWLKDGVCNACRSPQSIITAVVNTAPSTPTTKEIIPPINGWEAHTWYLVEVAFHKNNPIHKSLFYTGFLNGKGGQPGGYSGFVPLNGPDGDEPTDQLHRAYFCRALRVILSSEEAKP